MASVIASLLRPKCASTGSITSVLAEAVNCSLRSRNNQCQPFTLPSTCFRPHGPVILRFPSPDRGKIGFVPVNTFHSSICLTVLQVPTRPQAPSLLPTRAQSPQPMPRP